MQIMLWIMFAVFCISGITFMIIKSHAGVEAFVSTKSAWTLAHTQAKNALNDYFESHKQQDFESFEKHINTCLETRESLIDFKQKNYSEAQNHLSNGQIHPNTIPDLAFLYRYFTVIPQIKILLNHWEKANQKIYEFHTAAKLFNQAILNQAPPHIIKIQQSKIEGLYDKITPIERHLDNSVHRITAWIGQTTFWLTGLIYTLMGLMLYFGIRRTLNAFHERDALYHATFHHANVGIIQMDLNGRIQRMNQAFLDIFTVTPKDMKGRRAMDILQNHQNQPPHDQDVFQSLSPTEPTFSYHFKINSRTGQLLWLKATITKIHNQQNKALYCIAMIEDITELHAVNEQLKELAHHDYLTGLANKFTFDKKLAEKVKTKQTGVLFCMDLDKFKNINDTAGHAAGDKALVEVAQVLRLSFKKDDVIARIGGDEFAAFVSGIDMNTAAIIKSGITKAIEHHLITYKGQTFHLGISIGMAELDENTISSKQLMLQADTAAYEAKSNRG